MTSFWVFWHCAILTEYFFKKNCIFFQMLSTVVFGLVRLFFAKFSNFSKGPPSFFSYFFKEWMFKNSQMSLFTFVGTMRLTEDQNKFYKNRKNFSFFSIFSSRGFCRREYLTHWSPFAIFEPLIWRRLGPFPACSLLYRLLSCCLCSIFYEQGLFVSAKNTQSNKVTQQVCVSAEALRLLICQQSYKKVTRSSVKIFNLLSMEVLSHLTLKGRVSLP